ncbi:sugar transferase [Campylobacter jejuni]|uniref:sugar transferase n=1 Tax=Campylobacter jejuni TaxID=197 RepID=UPI000F8129AC|nr:sugar transferase [Campylobacter jejuni]ECP6146499.1 sugar transferase [Campylobacter jejuni]EEP3531595.1 sugar transferase [Campylobacter jejuni]RTI97599.1 sugar transferase [Campylobacter jejuni]RTJ03558.1 sugar transferase [Campylobacter jejuni]RTJ66881.1 sugar transferase [Campylobacter jejuni]
MSNVDILTKRIIDNWSYEFLDNFLIKEKLSDEHLLLLYKLGRYDFFLENFNHINRLSLLLDITSKELQDFMSLCLKQTSINENFLSSKYKNSYMSFLSSHLYIINFEDFQLFLKILNEVRNSQDFILQSFFLKNSIDFFYINSSDIFFKGGIYFVMLEIIYNNFLDTLGGKLYYDKLRVIAGKYFYQKKSYSGNRIALCLCGALRPGWRESIKALIDSFSKFGNIDVFVHSWDTESLWPGVGGNGIGWVRRFFQPMLNECPAELIMSNVDFSKKFPNVFKVISKEFTKKISSKDVLILSAKIKKVFLESYSKVTNCLGDLKNDSKQYYGIYQVYKSMEEYEKQNNFKYDFIIRARTDFIIEKNNASIEDLHSLEANDIYSLRYSCGLGDNLEIGRRNAMENYMRTWMYVSENKENPYFNSNLKNYPQTCMSPGTGFLSHYILSQWVDFLKLRVIKLDIQSSYINKFLFNNICFPDIKNELDKDIHFIRKNKIFNENQIEKIINFFDFIAQKYKIIAKYPDNLARLKVQNHLSYKLGQAMIDNSKSILGCIRMPFVLSYIQEKHYKEQLAYNQKIKINPDLISPSLKDCPDYKEALKIKNYFSYKLGGAFIKASKNWYKGGYIKFLFFDLPRLNKNRKNKNIVKKFK